MSWQDPPRDFTDPAYYADAASDTERELRAAFARFHLLGEIEPEADTPDRIAERNAAAYEISHPWENHPEVRWRWLWRQLDIEATQWEIDPDRTRALYDDLAQAREAGQPGVDELAWRTLHQARELTGHTGGLSSPSARAGWWLPGPQLRAITNADNTVARTPGRHLRAVPDSGTETTRGAADRALGAPRDLRLLDMTAVEKTIADTDALLNHEELTGDLDPGTDRQTTRAPNPLRENTVDAAAALAERQSRHAYLLAQVYDLAAQHARLNAAWDPDPDYAHARIERLEELNNLLRGARRSAASAGVQDAAISAAYRAGRDSVPIDVDPVPAHDPDPGLATASGHEIGAAIDAALPDEPAPGWDGQTPDPAPAPAHSPHLFPSEELNR
ncbi:hypothetical protein [Nocardia sp. NPDC050435]|uniref:hypothetical protein n=1 Tax=Nocardia sp. NPDC050435 TaxID=3155040 RepID=UPI003401F485